MQPTSPGPIRILRQRRKLLSVILLKPDERLGKQDDLLSAHQLSGCLPRQTAKDGCGQKAISRQITRRRRTRYANCSATGRKQIRDNGIVLALYPADSINQETALGMKQRACDLDRMEWRREMLPRRKLTSIPIAPSARLERFGFAQLRREGFRRYAHCIRKGLYALAHHDRTTSFGIPKILELPRHGGDAGVEYAPGDAARLTKHLGRLFGIAP